jgi:hypothetical protein
MGINFEATNWYTGAKAQFQVGGARGYGEALGNGQQAVGEGLNTKVDPGDENNALPQFSLLQMFGEWFHGLFHGRDESQVLMRDPGPDQGTPVPDQTAGTTVDILAPDEMPATAALAQQVEADA